MALQIIDSTLSLIHHINDHDEDNASNNANASLVVVAEEGEEDKHVDDDGHHHPNEKPSTSLKNTTLRDGGLTGSSS